MSLIVDCKFCGERISLRKMPHGKHVPFDANTDDQHSCQQSKKTKKTKKKQSKIKTSKTKSEINEQNMAEELDNYVDNSFTETQETQSRDIFKDETLDSLKNEIEVETKEKKIDTSKILIVGLVLLVLFLIFK
jgi:Fe2+ transport system protein B